MKKSPGKSKRDTQVAINGLIHVFKKLRPSSEISVNYRGIPIGSHPRPYSVDQPAYKAMADAVKRLNINKHQCPDNVAMAHLWDALAKLKQEDCQEHLLSNRIEEEVQKMLDCISRPTSWTVGYLVRGVVSKSNEPFKIGQCEFQTWTPPPEHKKFLKQNTAIGQLEARSIVEAVSQEHAFELGRSITEESLNLLRYAALASDGHSHGIPTIGMSISENVPEIAASSCFQTESPTQRSGMLIQDPPDLVDHALARQTPGWKEIEEVLNVAPHCRNELQERVVTALLWAGEANLLRLRSMAIVSIVTGLEALLLLPHESNGKKTKLCLRVESFPSPPGVNWHVKQRDMQELYECRCQCVHGGETEIPLQMMRLAFAAISQSIVGICQSMSHKNLSTLERVITDKCPSSLSAPRDTQPD